MGSNLPWDPPKDQQKQLSTTKDRKKRPRWDRLEGQRWSLVGSHTSLCSTHKGGGLSELMRPPAERTAQRRWIPKTLPLPPTAPHLPVQRSDWYHCIVSCLLVFGFPQLCSFVIEYLRTAFFPPQILNFYSIKKEIHFVMKQPSCEFSNLLCWEDFPPKFLL